MKIVLAVAVFLLAAVPASAQTNPVPVNQPFTLAWTHDGQGVTGFQCLVDGKPSGAVLAVTARSCPIAGQAAGPHTLAVESIATNAFGSSKAKSADLTATAGSPPPTPVAPSGVTVVVTVIQAQ